MIIADTHAWIWWVAEPDRLSARARRTFLETEEIGVCSVSCWEVAMLVRKGRLTLDREVGQWLRQALAQPKITPIPLSPEIATAAGLIEGLHGDPADRMIIASARDRKAKLVTRDQLLRGFDRTLTVW